MAFSQVVIADVKHVDAPHRVTSKELEAQLEASLKRLGMPSDMLESLTGIHARRFWDAGFLTSDAATLAAERVLGSADVDPKRVGVLISTSVSKDFIEPSVACVVHHRLGLSQNCLNFDLGNACLAFLNAMDIVGGMIEQGALEYGLVVAGESSRHVVECTVERLASTRSTLENVRDEFATLTLGSGAVAMLLTHAQHAPSAPQYRGSASLAATEYNHLCHGQIDKGFTDTNGLLNAGVALAKKTWTRSQEHLGWNQNEVELFALHQVSQVHTQKLAEAVGFDMERTFLLYPEFGNVGPASIPMVLSKANEQRLLNKGDRVILAGIGSGLNCTVAEVLW